MGRGWRGHQRPGGEDSHTRGTSRLWKAPRRGALQAAGGRPREAGCPGWWLVVSQEEFFLSSGWKEWEVGGGGCHQSVGWSRV